MSINMLRRAGVSRLPSVAAVTPWTRGWRGAIASLAITVVLVAIRALFPAPDGLLRWISEDMLNWILAHLLLYDAGLFLILWAGIWAALFILFNRILSERPHGDA